MILGILRVLFFFGPIMALGLIAYRARPNIGWTMWGLATAITAGHWIAYLTAKEDGANELGFLFTVIWTPLVITTLAAWYFRGYWQDRFSTTATAQFVVSGICLIPSVIAAILYW